MLELLPTSTDTDPALSASAPADAGDASASCRPVDESMLIALLRAGDEQACAEVVRAHTPHLAAVARRYLACEADVDDAVQEAFAAAFASIDRFKGDARLSTWLHRIVVNAALMSRRRRMRRREVLGGPDDILASISMGDNESRARPAGRAEEPCSPGDDRAEARRVLQHIRRLPACHRDVLEVRHVQRQSTEQASRALGVTPTALKARLHRAKAHLLDSLRRGVPDCTPNANERETAADPRPGTPATDVPRPGASTTSRRACDTNSVLA